MKKNFLMTKEIKNSEINTTIRYSRFRVEGASFLKAN